MGAVGPRPPLPCPLWTQCEAWFILCSEDPVPMTPGGQWLENASFAAFPVFLGKHVPNK